MNRLLEIALDISMKWFIPLRGPVYKSFSPRFTLKPFKLSAALLGDLWESSEFQMFYAKVTFSGDAQ